MRRTAERRRQALGVSEPVPLGVFIVVQVPLAHGLPGVALVVDLRGAGAGGAGAGGAVVLAGEGDAVALLGVGGGLVAGLLVVGGEAWLERAVRAAAARARERAFIGETPEGLE